MDVGIAGITLAVVSGTFSFLFGRWIARKRREKKAGREVQASEAAQSRQVRRAGERRKRR